MALYVILFNIDVGMVVCPCFYLVVFCILMSMFLFGCLLSFESFLFYFECQFLSFFICFNVFVYPPSPAGKNELERTALLCLRMVEVALEKQQQFMDMLRTIPQRTSVLASPLEQLLLSINPQTHAADYLLKIAR